MAFPVTLNGRTYTLADFEGTNYVDGLPDAFEDFVTHAGDIYNSTSTSSVAIGTGSKTFTTADSGKPYQAGTPLRIADAAAPETNFLDCIVTSYSGTTLVVDVFGFAGSGTKTSWTINIGGAKTVDGTLAIAQGGTGATSAADARTNIDVYSKSEADSKFLDVSGEASNVTMTGDVTIGDTAGDTLTVNAAATFVNGVSFGDNVISGDDIDGGTISNFASTGIDDNATSTAITIDSSENVGIGTASPDAGSQLSLFSTLYPSLFLNNNSTTGGGAIRFAKEGTQHGLIASSGWILADTSSDISLQAGTGLGLRFYTNGNNERMRIDSSGNVGIGTTSPARTLHVNSGATNAGIKTQSTDAGAYIEFEDDSSTTNPLVGAVGNDAVIITNSSERMRIDSSGNVGIGITSPSELLHIAESTGTSTLRSQNDSGSFYFGIDNSTGGTFSTGNYSRVVYSGGAYPMVFATNNAERMRIDSSGNLLVGTTDGAFVNGGGIKIANSQAARLKLCDSDSAGTGSADGFELTQSGTAAYIYQNENDFMAFGTNALERMRIDSSGTLFIGKSATSNSTAGYFLEPGSTGYASFVNTATGSTSRNILCNRQSGDGDTIQFRRANTQVGSISVTASATAYNTSSDQRLKENIVDAPAGNIDDIRVRSFNWKADGSHQTYGMVAQELVDVAPEAVAQGDTEDDMWAVDYSKLVPMMIKEIQDLKAEVAALKGA